MTEETKHHDLFQLVMQYQVAAATERMYRDQNIAAWRDHIHSFLQQLGNGDPKQLHEVVDAMDEFLRRSKK